MIYLKTVNLETIGDLGFPKVLLLPTPNPPTLTLPDPSPALPLTDPYPDIVEEDVEIPKGLGKIIALLKELMVSRIF